MGPPELKPPLARLRMGAGAAGASLRVEAHAGMATICRRWKAASILRMCRSCTGTTCAAIHYM